MDCANAQKPITTDLRRWFDQHMRLMADEELREGFGNLCDAIDAVQANLECENDELYAENDALRHERDEGWVELPRDADGEPIHIGDELEGYGWPNGGAYCRAIVNEAMILAGPDEGSYRGWLMWAASDVRHHTPDTWERIIRDAMAYAELPTDVDMQLLVARCRALAGEAE